MMKRIILAAALLCLLPCLAQARGKVQDYCMDGGQKVTTPGASAVSTTSVQRSYPSCTITVYLPGTTTIVTLYSTASGTAQANPFTAASTGRYSFYTDEPLVDVRLSGGGIATPFTRGDVPVPASIVDSLSSFGAFCDGTTNDASALSAASTALGINGGTILVPNGKTCVIGANVTVDADVVIDFSGGGKFSVSNTFTLTIGGPITAEAQQIFSGAGTVVFGGVLPAQINPIWWGGLTICDNATDAYTSLQAAINSIGNTTPILRSGGTVIIPCRMAIGTTVLIYKKSVIIEGNGSGPITATGPSSSTVRWIGAANVPMFEVKAVALGSIFRRFHIYGNATNKPRSAISYVYTAADAIGPSHNYIEDMSLGGQSGDTGFTAVSFVDMIYVGDTYDSGSTFNNDFVTVRNTFINGCTGAGFRQGSAQNVQNALSNSQIFSCAKGIQPVGSVNLDNVHFFSSTTADIYVPALDDYGNVATGRVIGREISSESSKALIDTSLGFGFIDINGGYFQVSSSVTAGSGVIYGSGVVGSSIRLHNFWFTDTGASTAWSITERTTAGGASIGRVLELDNIWLADSTAVPTITIATRNILDQMFFCQSIFRSSYTTAPQPGGPYTKTCNMLVGFDDPVDLTRYDIPNQTLRVGSRAQGYGTYDIKTASTAVSVSGATTTITGALPANSLVLGVTATVTTAVTCSGACTWGIGTAAQPTKWGTGRSVLITTTSSMANWNLAVIGASPGTPYFIQTAEDVVLTPSAGTFSTGVITVTRFYVVLNFPVQ